MAKLLVEALILPFLSSIVLMLASTAQSQDAYSTQFQYIFNNVRPTTLTYQGSAHFSDRTPYLRLSRVDGSGNAAPLSTGRVVYTQPIQFRENGRIVDFHTTVKFIITPNENDLNPGDGFAFFIAPVGSFPPLTSRGGGLGVFDWPVSTPNHIFAVEFDTKIDADFDPSYRHIGIDLGSIRSSNTTWTGLSLLWQEVTASIRYDAVTNLIRVDVTAGSQTFDVSLVYDLGNLLNDQVQVGLSASSGYAVAHHDVISWDFASNIRLNGAATNAAQIV